MKSRAGLVDQLQSLHALRTAAQRGGVEALDWPGYLDLVRAFCSAPWAAVIRGDTQRHEVAAQTAIDEAALTRWLTTPDAGALIKRVLAGGYALRAETPGSPVEAAFLAVRMPGDAASVHVLLVGVESLSEDELKVVLARAGLLADILPDDAGGTVTADDVPGVSDAVLAPLLGILSDCLQARRFQTAGYSMVNGLVSAVSGIDQAVLGWREGAYVRARFISHYERFERKTEQVRLMEAALEEAADQDVVIQRGQAADPGAPGVIDVAHRQLAAQLGAQDVVTFPLHDAEGEPCAALTLISFAGPIEEQQLASGQFVAQALLGHLQNVRREDAGIVQRLGQRLRAAASRWFGGENLWIKMAMMVLSGALLLAAVMPMTHRVSGTARFVTDETRLLTAPWQGTVVEVNATSGDRVEAGETLLVMDTEERLLQLAEQQAELQRNLAELDRARAEFNTVDTAVAEARVAQTRARIAQVQRQVNQAVIRAPLTGVVVEGDRRDLLSAPVSQGDQLMRVAEIRGIYLLVNIAEEDIQFIEEGSTGRFSLVARPAEQIPLTVERIIPMAQVNEGEGAVFSVNSALNAAPAAWWRPGMTGVARIEVGERSALWVLGHKAWNRLRLWLWW